MSATTAGVAVPEARRHPLVGRAVALLTEAGRLGVAGAIGGLIALGLGSRLAMRLVALTSGQIGTGVRPDSGAVPGEITAGGTAFLLLAGLMTGAVVSVAVGLVAGRWLPRGRGRTFVVGVLAAALPALLLLDPDNPDFERFGPKWFAVLLFFGCAAGYGAIVARLTARPRAPVVRRAGTVALVVAGLGVVALVTMAGLRDGLGLVFLAVVVGPHLLRRDGAPAWFNSAGVERAGRLCVVGLAVLAAGLTLWRIGVILA